MKRKQFTFYESFYDAIQYIGAKSQRVDVYDAICAYALYGQEPDMDRLSPRAKMVLTMCLPILAAGRDKAMGGIKRQELRKKMPMGASGELGEEEMTVIQRMMTE